MKRLTIFNALSELEKDSELYKVLFNHGTLEVGIFKPEKEDNQDPHPRDEIYIVTSGSGLFIKGNEKQPVEVGEVLFVPAGVEHKFIDFTDDFTTWVFFYGPEGGEAM